jgi:hypothetical protein
MIAMKLKMIVTVAALSVATSAHAAHWDGQKLYESCFLGSPCCRPGDCWGYVNGAINALLHSQPTAADAKFFDDARFCLPKGMKEGTLMDVVGRYLANHPEKRHLSGSYLIKSALLESYPCPEGDGE